MTHRPDRPGHVVASRISPRVRGALHSRAVTRIALVCALLVLPGATQTTFAQEGPAPSLSIFPVTTGPWVSDGVPAEWTTAESQAFPARRRPSFGRTRGKTISSVYVSLGVLQAMDAITTMSALSKGAREVNPVLGGVAGNPGGLIAAKAAATAGTIYLTEKVWKKNRPAAIALLAALNSVTAVVVTNNMRVARHMARRY